MCENCVRDPEFAKNYDECVTCGHYRCEHFEGPMKTVYSKDHPEDVGTVMDHGMECMNDCDCLEFKEPI